MSQADSSQASGKTPTNASSGSASSRKSRAVACAECRRLKLKCDRQFPCLNCRRREVASLCPNGSLITRPRGIVAEGAHGKHDVIWMSDRIRKLEEALALVQSKISDEPHPLLLESICRDVSTSGSGTPEKTEGSVSDEKRKPEVKSTGD